MPFGSSRADLLERSLQGYKGTDREVRALVATAGRIPPLTAAVCAPRPEFVRTLGIRLRAEALTVAAREISPASRKVAGQTTGARRSDTRPKIFVIGRGVPRILAGATASLLLAGAVVGGSSRSALPGGLLYPVKQLLNSASVQLAGSDFDRGVTLLSQAQGHISDAEALVERDGAQVDPASVNEALVSAFDAVTSGQRALMGEFDRTGNAQALIAIQDFVVRSTPRLNTLRPTVPAASAPDVDALITLLQEIRTTLGRKIVTCGQPCAALGDNMLGSSTLTTVVAPAPGLTAATTGPDGVVPGPSLGPLPTTISGTKAANLPHVTVGSISGTEAATLPHVTVGSITVTLSPTLIPLLPLPLPLLDPTTSLPPLPNGLPVLP